MENPGISYPVGDSEMKFIDLCFDKTLPSRKMFSRQKIDREVQPQQRLATGCVANSASGDMLITDVNQCCSGEPDGARPEIARYQSCSRDRSVKCNVLFSMAEINEYFSGSNIYLMNMLKAEFLFPIQARE